MGQSNTDNSSENAKIESEVPIKKQTANELIKNSIERRVTRSMKKLISKEEVSINAINALIIPEADRYNLTAIALKLHQSITLTQVKGTIGRTFQKKRNPTSSLGTHSILWTSHSTNKDILAKTTGIICCQNNQFLKTPHIQ